jgi:hypothetical protein
MPTMRTLKKAALLVASHAAVAAGGFAAGIYALPLLTAPPAPTAAEVGRVAAEAEFSGRFRRDLKDSDALHWGEGSVSVGRAVVAFEGRLSPGPDYRLYLSPQFVETEADFLQLKPRMLLVGDVRTFENFIVPMPPGVDPSAYDTVIVWCEAFGQFITAARYR